MVVWILFALLLFGLSLGRREVPADHELVTAAREKDSKGPFDTRPNKMATAAQREARASAEPARVGLPIDHSSKGN